MPSVEIMTDNDTSSTMTRLTFFGSWIVTAVIAAAAAVMPPDCQSTASMQKTLTGVHTANLSVPDYPFGLVYSSNNSKEH
jgi:hypothetical protein